MDQCCPQLRFFFYFNGQALLLNIIDIHHLSRDTSTAGHRAS
jgi:hypothetical protein